MDDPTDGQAGWPRPSQWGKIGETDPTWGPAMADPFAVPGAETPEATCRRILEQGSLAAKLAPPHGLGRDAAFETAPPPAAVMDRPARDPGLEFSPDTSPLPRPGELSDPAARATCLARFAHHELMAVELFAWAILRWPHLPSALRRSWLAILADEQRHCRLYLERLAAHGSSLAEHSLSDYFWKHAPAMAAAPDGPSAFLAGMGLTFEQANLDFSLLYRDAFHDAGDLESAQACQQIHDDEVQHVRLAAHWLRELAPEGERDDVALY